MLRCSSVQKTKIWQLEEILKQIFTWNPESHWRDPSWKENWFETWFTLKKSPPSSGYHDGFQSNCQLLDLLVFTSDVILTDLIGARIFWWVQMVHPTAPCQKELEEFLMVLCHHLSGAGWKEAIDLYYDACWLETSSMIGGNNCYFSFDMQFWLQYVCSMHWQVRQLIGGLHQCSQREFCFYAIGRISVIACIRYHHSFSPERKP